MKIPQVIHQTWRNHEIPPSFLEMAHTWQKQHPGWEYCFWTDEMNRNFIKQHFPIFLDQYDNYPTNIQRVDAFRYFVLYKYGGIYIDMDFQCLKNITPLIENASCVLGKEPAEHCAMHNKHVIISNALMASTAGHPFMKALCYELENDTHFTDHPNDRILETTGPFMVSRLYDSYGGKEEVKLLEADLIYPLTKDELLTLEAGPPAPAIHHKLTQAYAIHHYAGTWWKKNELITS